MKIHRKSSAMISVQANITLLILVAYNPEVAIPATEIAWKETSILYPHIRFNRTLFISPNLDFCLPYENVVADFLASFYYKSGGQPSNLVILPTGCSSAMLYAAELSREWNVPIVASAGVDNRLADKSRFPTLIRMLPVQNSAYSTGLQKLMDFYNWTCITIICDPGSSPNPIYKQICTELSNKLMAYSAYVFSTNLSRKQLRQAALETARSQSRVIVILAHMDMVRQTLISASSYNMLTNDYVYITAVYYNFPTTFCGSPHWFRNDSFDEVAKKAFESLLMFALSDPAESARLKTFLKTIETDYLPMYNSNASDMGGEKQLVAIYTHAAFIAIAKIVAEILKDGGNLSDGASFSRKMYNRSFDSVSGWPLKVNFNGDLDNLYAVLGIGNGSTTHAFEQLLLYDARDEKIFFSPHGSKWIRAGNIPSSRSHCAYYQLSENQQLHVLVPAVSVILVIFLLGLCGVLIAKQKTGQTDTWYICPADISDAIRQTNIDSFLKLGSHSVHKKIFDLDIQTQLSEKRKKILVFKGQICWCKEYGPLGKKISLTKKDRKLLNYRHQMIHPNVAFLFGICPGLHDLKIISEYSPKGTLYDMIDAVMRGDIMLNRELKNSLIYGLILGLKVIHSSIIGAHGHLCPNTCIVDNRFTIRLTDFGMRGVNMQVDKDFRHQKRNTQKLLYLAPEILKSEEYPAFTKEGDIYAFAIILHQILFCCGPFGISVDGTPMFWYQDELTMTNLTMISDHKIVCLQDVITKLKRSQPPFRPHIPAQGCDEDFKLLLPNFWAEDAFCRPTVTQILQKIRKIAGFYSDRSFLEAAIRRLEAFSEQLEEKVTEKTIELQCEKTKTDELLFQLIPRPIVLQLERGVIVLPELFEEVTVCFTAVADFLTIVTSCSPMQTVDFLNGVFLLLDNIFVSYDVYKIETIADSYMVASGLPIRNGHEHAKQIAKMSLHMISKAKIHMVLGVISGPLQLQIGIHTGVCAASIVGTKKPRYCLFGDTINTASRMTTSGEALKIQVSHLFTDYIEQHHFGEFRCIWRGTITVKGKGDMNTYWLTDVCDF